jgi:hypothetical protein
MFSAFHRSSWLFAAALVASFAFAQEKRNLTTDEARTPKGKPPGAADYVTKVRPTDGQHLALTFQKLERGIDPPRPFLIWALGSSYCNMLGNGEAWKEEIPKRFPKAPTIEYRKMVGNSAPWQYLRGWARHLVIPDQPDLVLIYTIGNPDDLEKLIVELRRNTTADIMVPSIHWRERDQEIWGKSENAADQDVGRVREICRRYDVEFVESRADWADYLKANQLKIPDLLKDAVHQSEYGAKIINANILAHLHRPVKFSYDPTTRERTVTPTPAKDGSIRLTFTGNRVDLIGRMSPTGGTLRVLVDGQPADQLDAFLMGYVQPGAKNSKERIGTSPTVPRDTAPHGIALGSGIIPQSWTIRVTSDTGDFTLEGSVTGADGVGNAFKPFTSKSGQIIIEPDQWRRAERNRTGDTFTFEVQRAGVGTVNFHGAAGERLVVRLAQMLPQGEHRLELVPQGDGEVRVDALQTFIPPLK